MLVHNYVWCLSTLIPLSPFCENISEKLSKLLLWRKWICKQLSTHFSLMGGHYWHHLHPSVMNTFLEIEENITIEKTDIEFHSFDFTFGFLSFWHVDLICHKSILYWQPPHEKCRKNHFIWIGSLKMSLLTPLAIWCILLN